MATFTRNSTAYLQDGTLVNTNLPRFEPGRFGQAVMIEEGVTNLLSANQSSMEAGANADGISDGWSFWSSDASRTHIFSRPTALHQGTFSQRAEITSATTAADTTIISSIITGTFGGLAYTTSVYLLSNTNKMRVHARYWDSAGVFIDDSPFSTAAPANQLTRLTLTHTAPINAARMSLYIRGITLAGEWFQVDSVQFEQRPYATSWQLGGTPRAAETLTVPSAGVLSPTEGTIEFWVNLGIGSQSYLFSTRLGTETNNNALFIYGTSVGTASQTMRALIGTGSGFVITPIISTPRGVWNYIACRWTATGLRLTINSTTVTVARSSAGVFDTNAWVGSGVESHQANSLIDDLRISNRARTDQEILDAFASGQPLAVDSNVTALYNFDNSLQSAVVLHTGTTAVTSVPVSVRNPGLNHVGLAPVNVVPVSPPVSPRFSYAGTTPVEAVPVAELRPGLSHTGLSGVQAVPVAAVAPHRFNYVGLTPAAVVPVAPITPASFNRVGLSPAIVAPVSKITVLPEIRNPTRVIIEDSRTEVIIEDSRTEVLVG